MIRDYGLPETFELIVTGDGADAGFRYVVHWEPIADDLRAKLVRGCDAFIGALLAALPDVLGSS